MSGPSTPESRHDFIESSTHLVENDHVRKEALDWRGAFGVVAGRSLAGCGAECPAEGAVLSLSGFWSWVLGLGPVGLKFGVRGSGLWGVLESSG